MISPGATFGRYVIVRRVGAGGMGVVYEAEDPELGRRVALKLVRTGPPRGGADDSAAPTLSDDKRDRLLREAQAMAKVSHPNVIPVYDVGTLGDEVYVAMELVDGPSLRHWLEERTRTTREIVDAFVQAGRGLAAAHRAQLVHRDFKPDNALVGSDGRVRVVDFGLSRALGAPALRGEPVVTPEQDRLYATLTITGSVIGTPAFMAPEQHRGEPADPRSDQFSFCVALYEALAGTRPFDGRTYEELSTAVQIGKMREPPPGKMSRHVRRVLARGLSRDPAARFSSMEALLDALIHDPRRLRVGLAVAFGGAAALAAGALLLAGPSPERRCRDAARLSGVWDEARAADVARAFAASGAPFAGDALRGAGAALDDYAARWTTMVADTCAATHARGEQTGAMLDLRMACLAQRRADLAALAGVFAAADRGTVERAVPAAQSLPPLDECADVRALGDRVPPPRDAAARAQVEALGARIAEAHALRLAGKYDAGVALAETLVAPAAATGYRPLEAAALQVLGDLQARAGNAAASARTLADAVRAAQAGRDVRTAASAEVHLATTLSLDLRDAKAAREHLGTAAALVESLGGDRGIEARIAAARGQLEHDEGNPEAALPLLVRARELFEKVGSPDDVEVSNVWNDLGGAYRALHRFPEAQAALERGLAIRERTLGKEHPFVASSLLNLGNVQRSQGNYAAAQPFYERAVALRERSLGATHPRLADALVSSAQNLDSLGRRDEALVALRRAVTIFEQSFGPDYLEIARAENAMGDILRSEGKLEEALAAYRRALAIREKAQGPEHAAVAVPVFSVGEALLALGRGAEALAQFERALAIDTAAHGPDSVELAYDLTSIGKAHLAAGDARGATPPLERALALRLATPGDPAELAETQYFLAQALWDSGGNRARAKELATKARDALMAAGEGAKDDAEAVERWLAGRH